MAVCVGSHHLASRPTVRQCNGALRVPHTSFATVRRAVRPGTPTQSPSATGTYSLAQPRQTTQLGEQASLPRLQSLRGFFGPDDDADITLDLTTLSPASGSTPGSAPPDPQLGATPHGSPDTMQVDDTPASRNTGGEGSLSTENQTVPNMEPGSRLPRVMRLPQGAVKSLIVSPLPVVPRLAANSEFGLQEFPLDAPILLESERYKAPSCGVPHPVASDQ